MANSSTGYPSIDKPWLKYYSPEVLSDELPKTKICDYLFENNINNLNSIAIDFFDYRITYSNLFEMIKKTAKGLCSLGIREGDIVTVISTNTPETIYCIYALNLMGAIVNMEYTTLSQQEMKEAVRLCNSKVVIVLELFIDKFSCLLEDNIVHTIVSLPFSTYVNDIYYLDKLIKYDEMIKYGTEIEKSSFIANQAAVIVHSGGTTGSPKGVVLSNENLLYIVWAFKNNGVGFNPTDKYLYEIPPFHSFGMAMGVCCSLCLGMETILAVNFNDDELLDLFISYKPNHFMGSGAQIPSLLANEEVRKMDLSFFRTCGFGGSPLAKSKENELVAFLEKRHSIAKASIGYGMSELSSAVCTELNRYYGKPGSVGIPLPKSNVKVVDVETGADLSYGEKGELCFDSPGLMLEYFSNPKETEMAIFVDNEGVRWLRSGDLGYVDEDGFVFITGRIKRIYSTRSEKGGTLFKLFPDYVASVICEVNGVSECAVVCVEDRDFKNIAVAYIVLDEKLNKKNVSCDITSYLINKLPQHSVPKKIVFVDNLPRTPVGKVDLRFLEDMARKKT